MELNQALRTLIELAQQNVIEDDELEAEATRQQDAIDSAELFLQELENPSPIKVVFKVASNGCHFMAYANVPIEAQVKFAGFDLSPLRSVTYPDMKEPT